MIALGSQHMSLFGTKQQSRLSSHPQECLACDLFYFVGWSCARSNNRNHKIKARHTWLFAWNVWCWLHHLHTDIVLHKSSKQDSATRAARSFYFWVCLINAIEVLILSLMFCLCSEASASRYRLMFSTTEQQEVTARFLNTWWFSLGERCPLLFYSSLQNTESLKQGPGLLSAWLLCHWVTLSQQIPVVGLPLPSSKRLSPI